MDAKVGKNSQFGLLAILVSSLGLIAIHSEARAQDPLGQPHVALIAPSSSKLIACDEVDDETRRTEGDADENESTETQDENEGSTDPEEAVSTTLLGERVHQIGPVTAEYLYTGQAFNNARGGISTKNATRYRGNLDLTLSIDTGNADWWKGGKFSVYLQQSHGRTLSQDFVGDAQFYSNIDTSPKAADLTQLGEYWYQHMFGEDRMSVKLGRQDPNTDFAFADLGGDFVNSSFLTLPNIPLPTWPTQTLGVSSLYHVNEKLRLGGGAYDQGRDIGQWWMTSVTRGMFFIGQVDYQPLADVDDSLLTLFRFGSWYTTSDTAALDGNSVFDDNYGFYTTLDRMIVSEDGDAAQGLGTFFQFSWAPSTRNLLDRNFGAGLVYRGIFPERDDDTLGIGFSLVEFSPIVGNLTGQTFENAVELFYKARLKKGLTIQPDMQYIARPSGIDRDALVVGIGFEVAF